MAEEGGEEGEEGKLPCVDHGPLNEGAVGKKAPKRTFCSDQLIRNFQFQEKLIVIEEASSSRH